MWILSLDYFGSAPKLFTFGQQTYKTMVGVGITLCSLIMIIIAATLFGRDFYLKETPRVFIESVSTEVFDNITITPSILNYMFRLEDSNGNYFDYSGKLNLVVTYLKFNYNETIEEFEYDYVDYNPDKCSLDMITDVNLSKGRNLSEWFCLNYTDYGLSFGGSWSGKFVYYWNIEVNNCYEESECLSMSELDDTLKDEVYFSMYYPQYYFSPGNFNQPLSLKYENQYTLLNSDTSFKNTLYFKAYTVEDDRGWIFKDVHSSSVIAFDNLDKSFGFRNKEDEYKTLYFQSIYFNSDKILFHRNYMKIQELAAMIGGFMKMIMFIAQFMVSPYSNYLLNQKLINLILSEVEVSLSSDITLKANYEPDKIVNQDSYTIQKKDDSIAKINNFVSKDLKLSTSQISLVNDKQRIKQYSFNKYAWNKLRCKTPQALLDYEASLKILNSKLDIASFLRAFQKSDVFESVFLNDAQIEALNFAKRPSLSGYVNNKLENKKAYKSVVKYFQSKQKEKSITDLDTSIYRKLGDDLKAKIGEFQHGSPS